MNILIKKFAELSPVELYKILQLRSEIFVLEQQCLYQDLDDKDFNSFHLMYFEENTLIAYLRIVEKGISYPEIFIGRVVVKQSHRRLKLGFRLMTDAIQFIENNLNEKNIRISAQTYLQHFYESLGFVVVSEPYLDCDIPHVEMLRR
jgi:ElaA protein